MNKAPEGAEGYGKAWMFDEESSYAVDQDGHVKGPMLIRRNGEWKKQERVTDFGHTGTIQGKEFVADQGPWICRPGGTL